MKIHIEHLTLRNFRNYSTLELDLPIGIVLIEGSNGQGKSNLLEAIYMMAIAKSPRAKHEDELVNWDLFEECYCGPGWACDAWDTQGLKQKAAGFHCKVIDNRLLHYQHLFCY